MVSLVFWPALFRLQAPSLFYLGVVVRERKKTTPNLVGRKPIVHSKYLAEIIAKKVYKSSIKFRR